MSNFFKDQTSARNRTKILLFLYSLAVLLIIVCIYAMVIFAQGDTKQLWDRTLFLKTSLSIISIVVLASFFKFMELKSGGASIASMLGGTRIRPDTKDFFERKVLNIVEEMAIASGLKVPPVYLMKSELGINAFAAGTNPGNAIIGVSRGTIELLNRDELQGVIAHEFSHILNGDMALNMRLIGVLYGIMFIALTGQFMFATGFNELTSPNSKIKNILTIIFGIVGLSFIIIGYTGVFFASLIKMAISREREYLADASAVQFTRNPMGIANALKKIGGLTTGSKIDNFHAEEASHLFFSAGVARSFSNLFSTHPPLIKRIKKLEPTFDGQFNSESFQSLKTSVLESSKDTVEEKKNISEWIIPDFTTPTESILESIGTLGLANITSAHHTINQIPERIYQATHDPFLAPLVIYSILLDPQPETRKKQLLLLQSNLPSRQFQEFSKLVVENHDLTKEHLLIVLDLTLPTFDLFSMSQLTQVRNMVSILAKVDDQIDLYEYVLEIILLRHFDQKFYPENFRTDCTKNLNQVLSSASNLFLALAVFGNPNNLEQAEKDYITSANTCEIPVSSRYNFGSLPKINFSFLDLAIKELTFANYNTKEIILKSCLAGIQHNQSLSLEEMALIRAIADSLNCPLPFTPQIS